MSSPVPVEDFRSSGLKRSAESLEAPAASNRYTIWNLSYTIYWESFEFYLQYINRPVFSLIRSTPIESTSQKRCVRDMSVVIDITETTACHIESNCIKIVLVHEYDIQFWCYVNTVDRSYPDLVRHTVSWIHVKYYVNTVANLKWYIL